MTWRESQDAMPLTTTKEVIDGALVTRFNGNNPGRSGAGDGAPAERRRARPGWITKDQKRKAKIRAKEETYRRRYLSG